MINLKYLTSKNWCQFPNLTTAKTIQSVNNSWRTTLRVWQVLKFNKKRAEFFVVGINWASFQLGKVRKIMSYLHKTNRRCFIKYRTKRDLLRERELCTKKHTTTACACAIQRNRSIFKLHTLNLSRQYLRSKFDSNREFLG